MKKLITSIVIMWHSEKYKKIKSNFYSVLVLLHAMRMLITAATVIELKEVQKLNPQNELHFFVHGVGIMNTMYHLQNILNTEAFDVVIQCGIAGAYNPIINISETVLVAKDTFESGAQNVDGSILSLTDIQLHNPDIYFCESETIPSSFVMNFTTNYPKVNALTVAVSSGNKDTIRHRISKYKADIESMEGAALHYICNAKKIPFVQVRTISNRVEERNKNNWKIESALHQNAISISNIIAQIM